MNCASSSSPWLAKSELRAKQPHRRRRRQLMAGRKIEARKSAPLDLIRFDPSEWQFYYYLHLHSTVLGRLQLAPSQGNSCACQRPPSNGRECVGDESSGAPLLATLSAFESRARLERHLAERRADRSPARSLSFRQPCAESIELNWRPTFSPSARPLSLSLLRLLRALTFTFAARRFALLLFASHWARLASLLNSRPSSMQMNASLWPSCRSILGPDDGAPAELWRNSPAAPLAPSRFCLSSRRKCPGFAWPFLTPTSEGEKTSRRPAGARVTLREAGKKLEAEMEEESRTLAGDSQAEYKSELGGANQFKIHFAPQLFAGKAAAAAAAASASWPSAAGPRRSLAPLFGQDAASWKHEFAFAARPLERAAPLACQPASQPVSQPASQPASRLLVLLRPAGELESNFFLLFSLSRFSLSLSLLQVNLCPTPFD